MLFNCLSQRGDCILKMWFPEDYKAWQDASHWVGFPVTSSRLKILHGKLCFPRPVTCPTESLPYPCSMHQVCSALFYICVLSIHHILEPALGNGCTVVTKPQGSHNPRHETCKPNIIAVQSSEDIGRRQKHWNNVKISIYKTAEDKLIQLVNFSRWPKMNVVAV